MSPGLPPFRRLGRLRASAPLRRLRTETRLEPARLIQPLFVTDAPELVGPVDSLPGVRRFTPEELAHEGRRLAATGVGGVLVFGVPAAKDAEGSGGWQGELVPSAVAALKAAAPALVVATDVCLCPYTDHGHCGLLAADGRGLDEPATLERLAAMAVAHARAGADLVAPSAMIDGQVAALRAGLDAAGSSSTGLLAYAAKFASAFYGPFRDAARSAPTVGDRRGHQLDPGNGREALAEVRQDLAEGADAVMVKPAGPYLDVIAAVRQAFPEAVIAAYQVSGEHAMLQAAVARGWLDERRAGLEALLAIRRAGADWILTYSADRVRGWLDEESP